MRLLARAALTLSFVLPVSLSQTGCLPSSQRDNTRALTPGDSLSRRVAVGVPVDSLRLVWTADAPDATPFELPTSITWLPDSLGGAITIVDTRRGSLHVLSPEGAYVEERTPQGLLYPYLAGLRADTLVLHSRGHQRLDFVVGERVVRQVPLAGDYSAVLATDAGLWAKRTDEADTYLARLDASGREAAVFPLAAPHWRHVGFLRAWDDAVVSLSGYRPVVDVLPAAARAGTAPDTLALVGFDSPQLVRSYQFLIDEIDAPPLLTPSAAVLGDRLYVLNLRVDQLRVDVYDRAGRLERALVLQADELLMDVFPADLAVHATADGLRLVVVLQHPGRFLDPARGRVVMLAWDGAPLGFGPGAGR